ncbi:MAG: nuclear transport factor 2 family protein [Chloroflexota bacterium]
MPKITVHASIGPSPRKQFLLEWHTAQAEENFDFLSDNVMDEIVLQVVGKKIVEGKEACVTALTEQLDADISEWVIHEIITHGREAAVNGEIHYGDGNVLAFCDVYTFKNTKANDLRTITAYQIPL